MFFLVYNQILCFCFDFKRKDNIVFVWNLLFVQKTKLLFTFWYAIIETIIWFDLDVQTKTFIYYKKVFVYHWCLQNRRNRCFVLTLDRFKLFVLIWRFVCVTLACKRDIKKKMGLIKMQTLQAICKKATLFYMFRTFTWICIANVIAVW